MKLSTRTWGSGERAALLIHGIMSDSRTWRRVGPALAERGYRVIAVDLRGHGASGRAATYAPSDYAADVVETVNELIPGGVDLAIGHSLGGLTLAYAVDALRPAKAVYVDPAWNIGAAAGIDPAMFAQFAATATAESIAAMNPKWEQADIEVELETLSVWDPQTALYLSTITDTVRLPEAAVAPSLVVLADNSFLIGAPEAEALEQRGFEVRTVPGAGHTVHRDDFEGFTNALDGWI
jgi:pimeloyl-ACP methyl ester carboxylesterase